MGNPAVFQFRLPDGSATYYLHWADPGFQIPVIAEWIAETLLAGGSLTLASWEAWFVDHYVEEQTGLVRMERTKLTARTDPHVSHGALHRFRLTVTARSFEFEALSWMYNGGYWETVAVARSARALLQEGVNQVRLLRRRASSMRRARGLRPDQRSWVGSVSAYGDWLRQCEERVEKFDAAFPPPTGSGDAG
ncbi:hypothetical protein [Nocardia sp. NPDC050435]|uniref:hypothetical protein n=1 Tax=Nocardia sp. NPDC050435 TaxID=3155040 RepID=UPI0033C4BA6B